MNKTLPYQTYDAQDTGPQYLEDLATGYWFSEVLFTAVEMDLFSLVGAGATVEELSGALHANPHGVERFLQALCAMGLVVSAGQRYFNTKLSSDYLLRGKDQYQGDSILWRKYLRPGWNGLKECVQEGGRVDYTGNEVPSERNRRTQKYIRAMDGIAKIKAHELVGFFENGSVKGEILDVGAGSGAVAATVLEHFPEAKALFIDLPDVLDQTREFLSRRGLSNRSHFCPANILEPWPVKKQSFDLVILSNILHAYSEEELPHILRSAADCLGDQGVLLIHDFFREHYPEKAALSDLNMFINTYNGRVFSGKYVQEQLLQLELSCTDLVPLKTDTAVLFAAKDTAALGALQLDPTDLLVSMICAQGFKVYRISTEDVHIPGWTDLRCQFGCDRYGDPHCPPNSPSADKTREVVKDYKRALLLEGEPPTRNFQLAVLQAERAAFKAGFHKAFSFWAGPCSLCESCVERGSCTNTVNARPSMEGAGIDVFETAKRAGASLRTLASKDEFVKYFALILLE
ncbi:MAG: metal-binding protein [Nitrospirae bacterium GWC2_57_9]|nr:MAG: metal-binding protein [Nitrospirae bacterium GWC2_57_9]